MNTNLNKNCVSKTKKGNTSARVPKKGTTDASTQANRISTKTVSDDLDELYARWKMELGIIKGLKDRLTMFENEYTVHAKEMKELEEKERIESNRRKMRLREKEIAKTREEEQRKRSLAAMETKKLKDAVIAKCKDVEKQKELEEQKKVKEAEAQKLKEKNKVEKQKELEERKKVKEAEAQKLKEKNNRKRKESTEKEKEGKQLAKASINKVTSEDWKRDFGFKKPNNIAPQKPRKYMVPGSPVCRYKKPYVARKDISRIERETIILSDDDNSQRLMKRTPLLEKLGKVVKRVTYPVHAKNLNNYQKITEEDDDSESETESESDDDSLFKVIPKKITRLEVETVDIDYSIAGTSSQFTNCAEFLSEDELDGFLE